MKSVAIILVVVRHAILFYTNSYDIAVGLRVVQDFIYAVHVPLFWGEYSRARLRENRGYSRIWIF